MADDSLSLLFKIRGDSTGARTAVAETRAAVGQLRATFGNEFNQMQSASKSALESIGSNLNVFVGQRIPLVGGAFVRVTENLRGFSNESKKSTEQLDKLSKSISSIGAATGKSSPEVTSFLTKFVQIGTQAERDGAAIEFLGAAMAAKLIPQLEAAGTEMSGLAVASGETATGLGGVLAAAGPVGIAVAGIAVQATLMAVAVAAASTAIVVGVKSVLDTFFDAAKSVAEFRGRLFDLSQQLGISVETLSAFEILAKTTGGDLGSITASLGIFQKKLEEAQDPTSKLAAEFRELGVDTNNTESALRQTLAALAAMPEDFHQTATALELFGRGGKSVLAILKEMHGDLDGAIKRFRAMGIIISAEDARAADEFNDKLGIMHLRLRALLSAEILPGAIKALDELSKALDENRDVIDALNKVLGVLGKIISIELRGMVIIFRKDLDLLKSAISPVVTAFERWADVTERIAKALGFIRDNPFPSIPEVGAEAEVSGIFGGPTEKQLQLRIQAQKELTGAQAAANEDAKRIAENAIKDSERQFQIGKVTRSEQLKDTLFGLQKIRDAELHGIEQQRRLKLDEFNLAQKKNENTTSLINELAGLDEKRRSAEDKFIEDSKNANAKAKTDERKANEDHNDAVLKLYLQGSENRIKAIQDELATGQGLRENAALQLNAIEAEQLRRRQGNLEKQLALPRIELESRKKINAELSAISKELADVERGQIEGLLQAATKAALEAQEKIEALQKIKFEKREASLTSEKLHTTDPDELKRINDQLKALDAERTEAERQQAERRKQIAQDEADIRTAILFGNTSEIQRIGTASDAARIAALKTLAAARIAAEEETARAITEIHREAIERNAAADDAIKANQLRRRQEELKQQLEAPQLELEVRKRLNAELAQISKERASVEKRQIEDFLQAATKAALDVEAQLSALQDIDLSKRKAEISGEKPSDPTERKRVDDQLKALDGERTENEKQQAARRKQIAQDEASIRAQILTGNYKTIQDVGAAIDKARIASQQTLAGAGIKTAAEAAQAISKIQHDAATRDAIAAKADHLRRRQEELKHALEGANLELEARKKINAELTTVSKGLADAERQELESLLQAASKAASAAEDQIKALQEAGFRKRESSLVEEKLRTADPAEQKKINDQLEALDAERTKTERDQSERRRQIAQDEADLRKAILAGNAGETERILAANDAARTNSLRTFAAALLVTEEETARAISQIHRNADARDAAITKAEKLRRQQDELKQSLTGAALELEARKKINAELAAIAKDIVSGERQQLDDLQAAVTAALDVEKQIKALQDERFNKRAAALSQEKPRTTDPAELEKINDRLNALDIERTQAEREQATRRDVTMQGEAAARVAVSLGSAAEIKRTGAALDAATIASLKILAGERVKVENTTAQAVAEIHRDAEARDAAAAKASQLRERQGQLRHQLEGTQLELAARQRLNQELERISTERAGRERSQVTDLLKTATDAAAEAEARLKALQDTALDKRKADLAGEKLHTTDPAEIKRINDQIVALDVTRTENERQQSTLRIQNAQAEADLRAQIASGGFKTVQEIGVASDKIRLASQKFLADAGVVSAEESARAISEIKHDAEIRDAEITKTDRLRRREEEIKQILQGAGLEVEARKSINAELAQITRDLANVEKRQIEDLINFRTASALRAEREIKKIEDDALNERESKLKVKLAEPIDVDAQRAVQDQLNALGVERVETERQQELRITQIHRDETQTRAEILTANVETISQLLESRDAQVITNIRALAALRIKTEEEAEKEILAIKLAAIDREIEALRGQRTELGLVADLNARAKQENDINNKIKIALDRRAVIEDQGHRDTETGRGKDIDNGQKYANDLLRIQDQIINTERDAAEIVVRLMAGNLARRKDIINESLALQLAEEKRRHDAAQAVSVPRRESADARIESLNRLIESLRSAGRQESAEFIKAREEHQQANDERLRLNKEDEAEVKRHAAAIAATKQQSENIDERIRSLNALVESLRAAGQQESDEHEKTQKELKDANEQRKILNAAAEAEEKRHNLAIAKIRQSRQFVESRILVLTGVLDELRDANRQESEEYKKAVEEQAKAVEARRLLNKEAEDESERHTKKEQAIRDKAVLAKAEDSGLTVRQSIIRARLRLEVNAENDRHRQAEESIAAQRRENAESNRTHQEKNDKTEELNRLAEAERERHRLAMKEITDQAARDEAAKTPIGRALDSLRSGQLPELEDGFQSFADVATVALGAVGVAVGQLAQGVGALIQNWVLMGTTGPNAFRKLAATILASIAQQAATLAIMSLAYAALATTIVGAILLGGTPAQFLKAAALFGVVAVGAGLAGRAIAGDAFKQQGASKPELGKTTEQKPDLKPVDINRNRFATPEPVIVRPIVNITVTGQVTEGFKYWVEQSLVESVRGNGVMRKIQNGENV